ncbi:hypothetical protein HN011_009816, partial [Eciton burchellii]
RACEYTASAKFKSRVIRCRPDLLRRRSVERSCENAPWTRSVDEESLRRREARDNDDDNGGGEPPVNPRLGVSDLSTNRRRSVMFDAAVVFYASTK